MEEVKDQETPEEKSSKVAKKYAQQMSKLTALLGSDKPLLPRKKMPNDDMDKLVAELLKEEREALAKEIKEELKALLGKHAELHRAFAEKEKELAKLKTDKMKEFSEAADRVFNKMDSIDKKEQDYKKALTKAPTVPGDEL